MNYSRCKFCKFEKKDCLKRQPVFTDVLQCPDFQPKEKKKKVKFHDMTGKSILNVED